MGAWATYTPGDLLMFSPETYFRLYELYNADLWPAQVLVLALTVKLVMLTDRPSAAGSRWTGLLLALAWGVIAWFFFLERYADINLAAPWFAAGFFVQAALWAGAAVLGRPRYAWAEGALGRAGLALLGYAVVVHPLLGPLAGREWQGVELFGLAPDPTALGTLGLLLTARRSPWWLWPLPLAWCAVIGLTHLVMAVPLGLATPLLALVAVAARVGEGRAVRFGRN